jgi:hypothetical protein
LRERCVPESAQVRTIAIVDGYEALVRARRRKQRGWDADTQGVYNRHRCRVEGVHGEAKTQHGLRRAIRRGLANAAIQVYLTAAVINPKRLVVVLSPDYFPYYEIVRNVLGFVSKFFDDCRWKMRTVLSSTT